MNDLQKAYETLDAKTLGYTQFWDYAEGNHPLTYLSARLKEVFRELPARFIQNWCSVVIYACLDRITLKGFVTDSADTNTVLEYIWHSQDLDNESDSIHEAGIVCGESFAIAWPDTNGDPQVYYNDPRLCHCFYDAENPRVMTYAAKWWVDEDDFQRLTLYYPDRLEYYKSTQKADFVSSYTSLSLVDTAVNPYGKIPVFHFRKTRRAILSDLVDVIPLQNGVNKLLTDMMVAAEYQALPQRYVISQAETLGKLKNAANEIWSLPGSDGIGQQTSAGQFEAADLRNFLDAVDRLATSISAVTRTPKHYFFSQSGDPSGEALIAYEAPLNRKASKRIQSFDPTWRQLASFVLAVRGIQVDAEDITPLFEQPETVQPLTTANIRSLSVQAGVPLRTALRWEGKTKQEIELMLQDKEEEDAAIQEALANSLIRSQRAFDAGQQDTNPDGAGDAPTSPKRYLQRRTVYEPNMRAK